MAAGGGGGHLQVGEMLNLRLLIGQAVARLLLIGQTAARLLLIGQCLQEEAGDIFKWAEEEGLTGTNYVWIVTQSVIGRNTIIFKDQIVLSNLYFTHNKQQ